MGDLSSTPDNSTAYRIVPKMKSIRPGKILQRQNFGMIANQTLTINFKPASRAAGCGWAKVFRHCYVPCDAFGAGTRVGGNILVDAGDGLPNARAEPEKSRLRQRRIGYAVKEHIEYATDKRMLITYACNSFSFEKLVGNMIIYRPQGVWVDLPN